MKFIILLSLFSLTSLAQIWDPPEKELIVILNRAELTPEMQLRKKYKRLESIKVSRLHLPEEVPVEELLHFFSARPMLKAPITGVL